MRIRIMITSWFGEDFNKNPFSLPINNLGGAEYQTKALCLALKDKAEITYVNLGRPVTTYKELNIIWSHRRQGYPELLNNYSRLLKSAIKKTRPDIIISYLIYPCGDLVSHIVNTLNLDKKPILATVCGSEDWVNILANGQKQLLVSEHIVGLSLVNNQIFFSRSDRISNELKMRSNALVKDLRPIIDFPVLNAPFSQSLNILWISRLCWPKRFDLLLDAYIKGIELNIFRNSKLNIIGDGPDYTNHIKKVKKLLPKLKTNKINFLGYIENEKIASFIANSSISVHLSESEGYGNAPTECLLQGIPTILSGFNQVAKDFSNSNHLVLCELKIDSVLDALIHASKLNKSSVVGRVNDFSSKQISGEVVETVKRFL